MPNESSMLFPITFDRESVHFPLDLVRSFEPLLHARTMVATTSIDPAISIYPMVEWDILNSEIEALANTDPLVRRLQRSLLSHAVSLKPTSDYQLGIPRALKQHAGIRKRAVVLAFHNKLEIWNPETLKTYTRKFNSQEREKVVGILRHLSVDGDSGILDLLDPIASITHDRKSQLG